MSPILRRPAGSPRTVRLRVTWLFAVVAAAACSALHRGTALGDSYRSADALGRAVLSALERSDRASLERSLVTRDEHRTLLWDALPESKHLPFEYARSLNMHNTRKALDHAFRRYAGTAFAFVRLEFAEPAEQYEGFTLHLGTRLWVRRTADGAEGYLPILDVLLEYHGRWKPMNYAE